MQKSLSLFPNFTTIYSHIFSYILTVLLLIYILFYWIDYTSLFICVILITNLCAMLIFPVPITINLLAKLSLRVVLLVKLHYCV